MKAKHYAIILAITIFLIAPVVYVTGGSAGTSRDLRAIQAIGVPLEKKPIEERPGQNAAERYTDAAAMMLSPGSVGDAFRDLEKYDVYGVVRQDFRSFKSYGVSSTAPGFPSGIVRPVYGPLSPNVNVDKARKDLQMLSTVGQIITIAVSKTNCDFTGDMSYFSFNGNVFRPESDAIKTCCHLYIDEAVVDAQQGQDAQDPLYQASRLIRQQGNGDALQIGGSYGFPNAVGETTMDFLNHLLALDKNFPNNEKLAERISQAADNLGEPKTVRDMVQDAFPKALLSYNEATSDSEVYLSVHHPARDSFLQGNTVVTHLAISQAIHKWRDIFEHMPKNPNDAITIEHLLTVGQTELQSKWPANTALDPQMAPSIPMYYEDDQYMITQFRLLRTAIHLCEQRAKNGSFPLTLPRNGSDDIDPYSFKQFLYRRKGAGFQLWSVGHDMVDDDCAIENKGLAMAQSEFVKSWQDIGIDYKL